MKIYSVHYNKPEYISLQKESLGKYLKVPYEFIILDNSIDPLIKEKILDTTKELHISYYDCQNDNITKDSISHQNALYHFVRLIDINETNMLLDHDIFLIDEINEDYYNNYEMVFLPQYRKNHHREIIYPWPGLIIFNKIKTKNLMYIESGFIEGIPCDTGGSLYYYILDNKPKIKYIIESYLDEGELLMANLDNKFIHLISGSGWNEAYNLEGKMKFLRSKIC